MLRIDKLSYRAGPRLLLDQAEATINPRQRVGLVGRNGTGKTTLLRLITGELDPDGGSIDIPSRWRVGMTAQEAPSGRESLIETVLAADAEATRLAAEADTATDPHRIAEIHTRLADKDAHAAPARAARILAGLGFSESAQQRPCDEYSGGWRMRVALATLLFIEPDLLLLDEPTNHLDLEATLWLEDYLRRYPGTVLVVSHDRELLNRAVGQILHLEGGKLTLYQGGYDRFDQTRRARLELDEKLRAKQAVQRAHIQQFVDRFRYKASKAKQAQSRLKMLERMEPLPERAEEGHPGFAFPVPDPLSPPLYAMEDVSVGYDAKPVLAKLSLRLDADDRIALLGANGNGKSTLIKLLAGRLSPSAGEVIRSNKLRVGYFAQHQADELDLEATPVVELARRRPQDPDVSLRRQLGQFGFSQERADTRVGNLSGGEKARLLFALMTCDRPHILLLDEPTNHLDIAARESLVEAINAFEGAVVIVSHDPHVLELTTDRFWLVESGRVRPFDGDMEDYRSLLLMAGEAARDRARDPEQSGGNGRDGADRKQQRRDAADRRRELAPLKKRLGEAERGVERLEAAKAKLMKAMADPALYEKDSQALVDLQQELGRVEKELADAEERWLHLHDAWDQAQPEAS